MTKLIATLILTCATLHAQTVIVKGAGAGNVRGTGAGSVRGVAAVETTYSSGRFSIWSDNTNVVMDNDSEITWMRDANIGGQMDWTNAVNYCDNLETNGYSDWRLPSVAELSRTTADGGSSTGLADSYPSDNDPALPLGHPFINVQSQRYWTSTAIDASNAKLVSFQDGEVPFDGKFFLYYVWPCRGP